MHGVLLARFKLDHFSGAFCPWSSSCLELLFSHRAAAEVLYFRKHTSASSELSALRAPASRPVSWPSTSTRGDREDVDQTAFGSNAIDAGAADMQATSSRAGRLASQVSPRDLVQSDARPSQSKLIPKSRNSSTVLAARMW